MIDCLENNFSVVLYPTDSLSFGLEIVKRIESLSLSSPFISHDFSRDKFDISIFIIIYLFTEERRPHASSSKHAPKRNRARFAFERKRFQVVPEKSRPCHPASLKAFSSSSSLSLSLSLRASALPPPLPLPSPPPLDHPSSTHPLAAPLRPSCTDSRKLLAPLPLFWPLHSFHLYVYSGFLFACEITTSNESSNVPAKFRHSLSLFSNESRVIFFVSFRNRYRGQTHNFLIRRRR